MKTESAESLPCDAPGSGPAVPRASRRRTWRRRWLACGLLLFLALAGWIFREALLRGLARAWIVNDPLVKADAIVVLGGRPDVRPFAAARLYHEGIAPRILYMNVKATAAVDLGLLPPERELTRHILLANGVPDDAMTAIGNEVQNTHDESCAVRDWMKAGGARTIVIPTDVFHTRRVRWLFRHELKELGGTVCVRALDTPQYASTNWWRHEEGLIAFQNEVLKTLYYRAKY